MACVCARTPVCLCARALWWKSEEACRRWVFPSTVRQPGSDPGLCTQRQAALSPRAISPALKLLFGSRTCEDVTFVFFRFPSLPWHLHFLPLFGPEVLASHRDAAGGCRAQTTGSVRRGSRESLQLSMGWLAGTEVNGSEQTETTVHLRQAFHTEPWDCAGRKRPAWSYPLKVWGAQMTSEKRNCHRFVVL